jgi:hypothetical protein
MTVTVSQLPFTERQDDIFGRGARSVTVNFAISENSLLSTTHLLHVVELPGLDKKYLVNELDPEERTVIFTAPAAKRRLGLPDTTPSDDQGNLGPFNRNQVNAVFRIAEASSARNHFNHIAGNEVDYLARMLTPTPAATPAQPAAAAPAPAA